MKVAGDMDPYAACAAKSSGHHTSFKSSPTRPHRNGHACTVVARRIVGRIVLYISAAIPTVEASSDCVPS